MVQGCVLGCEYGARQSLTATRIARFGKGKTVLNVRTSLHQIPGKSAQEPRAVHR